MFIWADGKKQKIKNIKSNQQLIFNYDDAKSFELTQEKKQTVFISAPDNHEIKFKHKENTFDDYEFQILLPHKYSQFGPGVSVADINGDQLDDFYVGGAHQQAGVLYMQNSKGEFNVIKGPWEKDKACEDVSSVFFDANNDGYKDIYVVSGGNEFLNGDPLLKDRLYVNDGKGNFTNASFKIAR